jgi:hypothetical protein
MSWIIEMFTCKLTDYLKLFLMLLLVILFFPLLMIIPFLYVAYLSFYGKYGIVPIIKSLNYSL